MLTRREFLKALGMAMLTPWLAELPVARGLAPTQAPPVDVWVNDIHSQLNRTRVAGIAKISGLQGARQVILEARRTGRPIAIAAGRHAGGGQQFLGDEWLVDTTPMNQVLSFDRRRGLIEVEAGIQWPELLNYLDRAQPEPPAMTRWGIRQKQTGADKLAVGGAVSSNVHSRGLGMKPFISDVEAIRLLNADGRLIRCSRTERPELFRLVNGGYGLFGLIYSVTLRLVPRHKVQRRVYRMHVDDLVAAIETAQGQGALYGDFQFNIASEAEDFLLGGVMATYTPVPADTPIPDHQSALTLAEWIELVELAHTDKARAFERYMQHYLKTDGQIYWSDTHQLGPYRDFYHQYYDRKIQAPQPGSEAITELYVPRGALPAFMRDAQADFRRHAVNVIYGTVRFIERDDESFLAWARQPYACIIFNLHTDHSPEGIDQNREAFRRLIDLAIRYDGSYYLTYHRYARKDQVLACYPQFPEFLRLKKELDPVERFQSDWYRYYRVLFEKELTAVT